MPRRNSFLVRSSARFTRQATLGLVPACGLLAWFCAVTAATPAALAQKPAVRVRVKPLPCKDCTSQALERALGVLPRTPLPKEPLSLPAPKAQSFSAQPYRFRWALKFQDALRVRLAEAPVAANAEQPPNQGAKTIVSLGGHDLSAVQALGERYQVRFVPQIDLPERELDALQARALRKSREAQPDLGGLYWVDAAFESPEQMLEFGQALQALPEVEFVHRQALDVLPPEDLPPTSSELSGQQKHLGADPGVNGEYAWKQGYFGEGVRVADCEYSWQTKHEDLVDNPIQVEKGQTLGRHEINHGTAVIGIVVAGHNGYGVKGLAPKATPAVYPETNNRRVAAITSAIKDSKEGDIVMLEMQTYGHRRGLVPAEYDKSVWTVCKTGSAAGVLVIAAAGNGKQDLDAAAYKSYMDRGDSGALIIGAGTASKQHKRMNFSTYGKRVDVQAWGEKVVTTGYGDLKKFGGDKLQQYTRKFAGTSSATPIVAGAAALIQSYAKKEHGKVLSPKEMKELLIETGVAQQGGGHIGPMPDVKAAMQKLGDPEPDTQDPTVSIEAPSADVKETLTPDAKYFALAVNVDAKDDREIKAVHLEIDGKKVGDQDTNEPYEFELELAKGDYKLVAVATDGAKNQGRSKIRKIEIQSDDPGNSNDTSDQSPKPSGSQDSDQDSPNQDSQEQSSPTPAPSQNQNTDESKGEDSGCQVHQGSRFGWSCLIGLGLLGLSRKRRSSL